MEVSELRNLWSDLSESIENFRGLFDLEKMAVDIAEYEDQMSQADFLG